MYIVSRSFNLRCKTTEPTPREREFEICLGCEVSHLDSRGYGVEFSAFDPVISQLLERFENQDLSVLRDRPTAENLCRAIYEITKKSLPEVKWVEAREAGGQFVRFRPSIEI